MQQTKMLFRLRGGNQMNTGAFIHDLLDWIDNNLDSRLDIDTVARRAGYSKWHLQRMFKEHTGYPLAEYIRAQKLQKSVERLAHSDEPILNVAIALGFDSQQSFNRSFKRQYGQAPAHGDAVLAALKCSDYASNPHSSHPFRMTLACQRQAMSEAGVGLTRQSLREDEKGRRFFLPRLLFPSPCKPQNPSKNRLMPVHLHIIRQAQAYQYLPGERLRRRLLRTCPS
jgi:AraC family transcriptional activator of mar-sox-rob regulon